MAPKIWVGAAKNKAFATTSRLRNSHRASPARIESGPAKCGPLRQKYAPAYGVAAPTAPSLSEELDSIVAMNAKGLVLLCHKFHLWLRGRRRRQHGHRGRVFAIARASARRIVAIELGTCRCGRIGGASGSVITGKGIFFDWSGGTWA